MNGSAAVPPPDSVTALAILLSAVAQEAEGAKGGRQWDSLAALVDTPAPGEPAGERTSEAAGVPELSALRQQPRDSRPAEDLARVLLIRAQSDPDFRRALSNWRRRKGIRALARGVATERSADAGSERQHADDTAPKPWYRRVAVWVGAAIITPVLVATITQIETGFVGKLFDSPSTESPAAVAPAVVPATTPAVAPVTTPAVVPPAGGSVLSATAPNSPVKAETVTPLNTEPDETYAVADKVQLTAAQLTELSSNIHSGGTGATSVLSSIHAVPVGNAFTNVTVVGNEQATVTITDLQVVKHCQAPLSGTLLFNPSQGVNGTISIGFDLDSQTYYARAFDYGFRGGDYFRSKVVTLAPGETQTFDISVQAASSYCQFSFAMTVATPNGTVTENIDDNGRPFELTGRAGGGYAAEYVGGLAASLTPALNDPSGNYVQVDPKTFHG